MNGKSVWQITGALTLLGSAGFAQAADAQEPDAASVPTLAVLRYPGREWPRLFSRYTQPVMRGLLADQRGASGSLSLQTTLFRNDGRGMKPVGGVGRDYAGNREARVQFSLRF